MATVKERLDKHDREIAAIRGLLKEGFRIGRGVSEAHPLETRRDLRTLGPGSVIDAGLRTGCPRSDPARQELLPGDSEILQLATQEGGRRR